MKRPTLPKRLKGYIHHGVIPVFRRCEETGEVLVCPECGTPISTWSNGEYFCGCQEGDGQERNIEPIINSEWEAKNNERVEPMTEQNPNDIVCSVCGNQDWECASHVTPKCLNCGGVSTQITRSAYDVRLAAFPQTTTRYKESFQWTSDHEKGVHHYEGTDKHFWYEVLGHNDCCVAMFKTLDYNNCTITVYLSGIDKHRLGFAMDICASHLKKLRGAVS